MKNEVQSTGRLTERDTVTNRTMRVYKAEVLVILGEGGEIKCFSSTSPVIGFA